MLPQEIQEKQYSIPYHYLPWERDGVWRVGRFIEWGFEYLAVLNTVLDLVGKSLPKGQGRLLDFGCGDGRLISELLMRYPRLTVAGVDISEKALAFARAVTWGNPQVYFFSDLHAAVENLGQFDVIVAMEVLEHIPPEDLPSVITALDKALVKNGHLIVSVPTTNIPLNRKHYQHFTMDTIKQILGNTFILSEVYYIHRVGALANLIRRAVVNRFFVANGEVWLRFFTWLYNRYVRVADERTGAHMVVRFRKSDNDR